MNELGNVIAFGIALAGAVEFAAEITQYVIRRRHEGFQRRLHHKHWTKINGRRSD